MEKDVTRHIEEQLSAFLDGELPQEELALLVRRLERDESYRATLDRYALIGGALRNDLTPATATSLRRSIMAALDDAIDSEAAAAPETNVAVEASGGGQLRYLLAASLVVGVMAVFFGANFDQSVSLGTAITQTAAVAPAQTADVVSVAQESADPVQLRHQRELERTRLNQERIRSYLISHGGQSRSLQGAMTSSRMYVQQASFSE